MSFSAGVKEELSNVISGARHCQLAELASIIEFCIRVKKDETGSWALSIMSDNKLIVKKFYALMKKAFGIGTPKELADSDCRPLLEALRLIEGGELIRMTGDPASDVLLKRSCCKRSFLRGAYLCAGSMSDPKRSYHLEIVCDNEAQAIQLIDVMSGFDLEAKSTKRKDKYVVYLKESSAIVDFLGVCEAHVALMEMENDRIVKEVRNSVNRRVNCEVANVTKTVNAAARQIEDIEYLRDNYGLDRLPPALKDMAYIRLQNPDATLPELGKAFDPPLGKSGVNHRLRKLSEFASSLR